MPFYPPSNDEQSALLVWDPETQSWSAVPRALIAPEAISSTNQAAVDTTLTTLSEDGDTAIIQVLGSGGNAAGTNVAGFQLLESFHRAAGTVSIISAVMDNILSIEGAGAPSPVPALVVSGDDILLRLGSRAAETWTWNVQVRVI